MTLGELADALQCRLEGDASSEIVRVAGIDQAQRGDVTFVDNPRYVPRLASTNASAVIVAEDLAVPADARFGVLRSKKPYVDFARAVTLFLPSSSPAKGVDALSAIAADARIGPDVSIGPSDPVRASATTASSTRCARFASARSSAAASSCTTASSSAAKGSASRNRRTARTSRFHKAQAS
jgi:UDP-3-O-[3-hydroxymyristoyl] glucosamine N-acyltransferase